MKTGSDSQSIAKVVSLSPAWPKMSYPDNIHRVVSSRPSPEEICQLFYYQSSLIELFTNNQDRIKAFCPLSEVGDKDAAHYPARN